MFVQADSLRGRQDIGVKSGQWNAWSKTNIESECQLNFCGYTTLAEAPYFIVAGSLTLRGISLVVVVLYLRPGRWISVTLQTIYICTPRDCSLDTQKYEPI